MDTIVITVIQAIEAIILGVISVWAASANHKSDKQDKRRMEEAKLQLAMIHANSTLTVGVAAALKAGHCNGEVEAGLKAVTEAEMKYRTYLEGVALEEIR